MSEKTDTTTALSAMLNYVEHVFQQRLHAHFSGEDSIVELPHPPDLADNSSMAAFIAEHQPSADEYLTLSLSLIPHLLPGFLARIITENLPQSGGFAELGGVKDDNSRGFLPTGETVLFLLAGENLSRRKTALHLFSTQHWFHKKGILSLARTKYDQPRLSGKLVLDAEWIEWLITGQLSPPAFSTDFPAQYLNTEMEWNELILPQKTYRQLEEITIWIQHNDTLLNDWGMGRIIKPGYKALFHGPSGTGKTLTATLLGKRTNKDVFRIDLSTVVSKYIGETEKNLATLFDKAQNKNWILFFDEADALFGKRTNVRDAHDKYANQEVSYLLQRIETFSGLVILASNFKSNIDEAFTRRFQSIIYFPVPSAEERLKLWNNAFPKNITLDSKIDLNAIAQQYELTGANIVNIVQYSCLQALAREESTILLADVLAGIRKEFHKEGKLK